MSRFLLATAVALSSLSSLSFTAPAVLAQSAKQEMRFCVASASGNYAKVIAPKLAEQIAERYTVKVVTTKGSPEILSRLSLPLEDPNACDWGAVQLDAFATSAAANDVQVEAELYPEFVHLACRKDVDINNVGDLINNPSVTIGIGSEFSGNSVAWNSLSRLNKKLETIVTVPVSLDSEAAKRIRMGTLDCIFAVQGWKSKQVTDFVNLVGGDITLRAFWDDSFASRTITIAGKQRKLYTAQEIKAGTYDAKFQPSQGWFSGTAIKTVAIPAVLLSRPSWNEKQPAELQDYLARGVINADKAIKQAMK